MNCRNQFRVNILTARPVKALLRWPMFPVILQAMVVLVMGFLIFNGWGIKPALMTKEQAMILKLTNLTTLLFWGLWWPGMIALAIGFGRAWCTVCPMELVNRIGYGLGRITGLNRIKIITWLRNGWLAILSYITLQLLVNGLWIHRVPHYTSVLLLTMFCTALVSGIFLSETRSFCKTFCPAKALLSVYGRFTPFQLDTINPDVCEKCQTRDCVDQKNLNKFDARSCPSLVRPFARRQGDECTLCLQCAKVCPHENIGFGLVQPEAGSRRHLLLKPFATAFVMIASGFVAHEVIGEAEWLEEYFHLVPKLLNIWIPSIGFGWFEALWFLILMPSALWLVTAAAAYLLGHRSGGWGDTLQAMASGAAPVIAIAHLAKGVAKITAWGGYFPLAAADPRGLNSMQQIMDKTLARPAAWVSLPTIGWFMLAAIFASGWYGLRRIKAISSDYRHAIRAGSVVCTLLYGMIIAVWPVAAFEVVPDSTPIPRLRVTTPQISLYPQTEDYSFCVLGDMRWDSPPRIAILRHAQVIAPLFMVNLGDVTFKSRHAEWQQYLSELELNWNPDIPYFHIPGRHSRNRRPFGHGLDFFKHYFGREYFCLKVGNMCFIFLDTSAGDIPDYQIQWLSELLKECKQAQPQVVLFMHHPPRDKTQGITHALSPDSTQKLAGLLAGCKVTAIFAGHIHRTFQYKWHNIPVYITALDRNTWKTNPAEYYRVNVVNNKLRVDIVSVEKQV